MMVAGGVGVAGRAEGGQREEDSLWLGLDLSTQSLTAAVLRGSGTGGGSNQPVLLQSVNYEVCRSIFPPTFHVPCGF